MDHDETTYSIDAPWWVDRVDSTTTRRLIDESRDLCATAARVKAEVALRSGEVRDLIAEARNKAHVSVLRAHFDRRLVARTTPIDEPPTLPLA